LKQTVQEQAKLQDKWEANILSKNGQHSNYDEAD
jgi:hypothetical protein